MARARFQLCCSTVAIVYMIQFLLLLPILCYNLPFSSYFLASPISNNETATMLYDFNQQRVRRAYSYFKSQTPAGNLRYYDSVENSSEIYLTVAIITVSRAVEKKRQDPGYILQTSAGMDKFAKSHEFSHRTFVFVCNVDMNPQEHKEAMFLRKYLPFTERYGLSSFKLEDKYQNQHNYSIYQTKKIEGKYEKETMDYSYCLKVAKSFDPEYVLMVEDDAIPHNDLAYVLKYTLENHLVDNRRSTSQRKDFAYLKLYYPERWQGYAFDVPMFLELLSIGSVGGGVTLVVFQCLAKRRRDYYSLRLSRFLIWMGFFILTAEFVGRQNVMEVRRLSKYLYKFRQASECCTQAMLYPSAIVDSLTTYLTTLPSFKHTDLSIYDFTLQTNTPTYQLEPNLFYHVGMQSSLNKSRIRILEQFLFRLDLTSSSIPRGKVE